MPSDCTAQIKFSGDEQSGCGAGSHTSTSIMVKSKNRAQRQVEVDVVVKRGRGRNNGNRARQRRGRNGMQDTNRSYGTPGDMGVRSFVNSVPAGMGFQVPRGLTLRQKGDIITVRKCELFAGVTVGTTETFETPENSVLAPNNMPWLSGVAANFSKWRWRYLSVKYTAAVGTTASGSVGFGFGYDMAEGTPTQLNQVSAFDQFKLGPVWASWDQPIVMDTGRFSRDWYPYIGINVFKALTGNDQNDYAPGYLSGVATIGNQPDNTQGGQTWVDYEVELCDPISAALQPIGT